MTTAAYLRRSVVNACHSHHRGLRRFRRLDLRPSQPAELGVCRLLGNGVAWLFSTASGSVLSFLLRRVAVAIPLSKRCEEASHVLLHPSSIVGQWPLER